MPVQAIENFCLVKLGHMAGKCCPTWNRMLCFMLFFIVNEQMGKKNSTFITIRTIFVVAYLFQPEISLNMVSLVRTNKFLLSFSLVKNDSSAKYS